MGHYDSRGNYSPTPGPCIPLPPRNPERRATPPPPYDGDFYSHARRTTEYEVPPSTCHIGLKFIWDNGEGLGCDLPCVLMPANGAPIRTRLDEYSRFVGSIPDGSYQAQMLADFDAEEPVLRHRAEVQAALEAILDTERAEAAALQAIQDQRGFVANAFYTHLAIGKGALYGAWGLVKSFKEYGDLINPFVTFSNVVAAAWNADASNGGSWMASFRDNFSQEQHRELVEALGFDPSKISREQLADIYETACFVMADGPSRDLLARFAVDYVKAQNREEIAEFSGAVVFEIALIALLVMYTGGAGAAAKGAASVRNLALTQRLGSGVKRLGQSLRNARIKKAGRVEGKGAGAQIVEIERPKELPKAALVATVLRDWSHLTLSQRHFVNKVTTAKAAGNTMYTVPREVVLKDLKEIHLHGESIRTGDKFKTSSGRIYGLHEHSIHPVGGPGTVNLTSQQYKVLIEGKRKGRAGAENYMGFVVRSGGMTSEEAAVVSKLLDVSGGGGGK